MDYQFNLEWDELPEEFKEDKITEYIQQGEKRDCEDCDGEGRKGTDENAEVCETCKGNGQVDPDPDDEHQREEAESDIEAHFPIYF